MTFFIRKGQQLRKPPKEKDFWFDKYDKKRGSTKGRLDKLGNPIEFRLSFEEWKSLWEEAGKLPIQPNCLSRKDDIGHYEIGNCYVSDLKTNALEAWNDPTRPRYDRKK